METDQKSFEYAPLEEGAIRILILAPASSRKEDLQVQLIHTQALQALGHYEYSDPEVYEAISYTWGAPIFSHKLECEGCVIKITASVDSLLRQLRKSTAPRSLWLDQVCINQQDEVEKGVQVQLMGQIYSRARKVHVWLGDTDPNDRIEWVAKFFKEVAVTGTIDKWQVDRRRNHPSDLDIENVVDRFLSRPWFERRWILQEVSLAQEITVRCGSFKLPWLWLTRGAINLTLDTSPQERLSIESSRSLETIAALSTPSRQLLDLMFIFDRSKCFDPRDRIFALYGIAGSSTTIPVDYKTPWLELYLKFAVSCIRSGRFIILLQHLTAFGSISEEYPDMPSWLPNWNGPRSSVKRFWIRDLTYVLRTSRISQESAHRIHSSDTLRYVSRVHRYPNGKRDPQGLNKHRKVTTESTSHQSQEKLTLSHHDFAMLFYECLKCGHAQSAHPDPVPYSPDEVFAQILSAAIMDMSIQFNKRNEMLDFISTSYFIAPSEFKTRNIDPEHPKYLDQLYNLEGTIKEALQEAAQRSNLAMVSKGQAENVRMNIQNLIDTFRNGKLAPVVKLLKNHSLFSTGWATDRGRIVVPGITTCRVTDRDFVMDPMPLKRMNAFAIIPTATAFLMRPLGTAPIIRINAGHHFRIVGLCFVGVPYDLDRGRGNGPNRFIIA